VVGRCILAVGLFFVWLGKGGLDKGDVGVFSGRFDGDMNMMVDRDTPTYKLPDIQHPNRPEFVPCPKIETPIPTPGYFNECRLPPCPAVPIPFLGLSLGQLLQQRCSCCLGNDGHRLGCHVACSPSRNTSSQVVSRSVVRRGKARTTVNIVPVPHNPDEPRLRSTADCAVTGHEVERGRGDGELRKE
jgi:hypothetical protein